jgi:spore coat polysaccharide biosynthesis protein SpsF
VVDHGDSEHYDLVTTVFPRTFPAGQNAELIRARALLAINPGELLAADKEHVTPFFYRRPDRFRILNVQSGNPQLAELSLVVDTVEDLRRLEQLSEAEVRRFSYDVLTRTLA